MRVQVITRDNGFGLSKDVQVLREALKDHDVDFTPFDKPRKGGDWHWNIHLELVNHAHFRNARINAFVPNAEWMQNAWVPLLSGFDVVIAKTKDCERIFKALHSNVVFTGWTSPDTAVRVNRERTDMIHCAGDSLAKGTHALIQAAAKVPNAKITILTKRPITAILPSSVTIKQGVLPQEEFDTYRRAPIHLCPSNYEGFGHYINEARAMGATIITTDAPPMNEMVNTGYGILAPVCSNRRQHLAEEGHVCVEALAESMQFALEHNSTHGSEWGPKARSAYEEDRLAFHERINALVK
jgi:glycosyltransferase involved in cell wall biosynthesis